jgi:hypothetical protein
LHIGWDEFVEAFRNHDIPEAVMNRKVDEFRHLKMGGMSVQEYTNRYQELMRYVPDDTNTEKRRSTGSGRDCTRGWHTTCPRTTARRFAP